MIIIIDGYNLLRQVFPKVKGCLEKQRNLLIKRLSLYQATKENSIKEIIIVFDAGPFGHATREIYKGVVVMFSGQRSSADDWIVEFSERKEGNAILLITKDRELIHNCEEFGVKSMDVFEFYTIMNDVLQKQIPVQNNKKSIGLEKYDQSELSELDDFFQHHEPSPLDLLMEEASIYTPTKKNDIIAPEDKYMQDRLHKRKKLSKKEKKTYSLLKKLK